MDVETLVAEALAEVGVGVEWPSGPDGGVDLLVGAGGTRIGIKHRSLVTEDVAKRLLADVHQTSGVLLLAVGDRVTQGARALLLDSHAGYYDLRGHLALRAEGLVINTDVEPVIARSERKDALAGKAGLEVATTLLMEPSSESAVRQIARDLGRSPSTVSEVLGALRREGLVDDRHRVTDSRLFWQVVERWPTSRTYLSVVPPAGQEAGLTAPLRLGLVEAEASVGWALTDTAGAVAYGAPLAVRSEQLLDFYVPDVVTLRRAQKLLGAAASPSRAGCAVRVAPVPAACGQRVDLRTNPFHWPLAHPLFVALDLAQDVGRGREILDAWTPDGQWTRVW